MIDWPIIVAGGIFGLGIIGFYFNTSNNYLSIREHETYNSFITRELDVIRENIVRLENTRPTTGELEARFYRIQNQNGNYSAT